MVIGIFLRRIGVILRVRGGFIKRERQGHLFLWGGGFGDRNFSEKNRGYPKGSGWFHQNLS